MPGMTGLEAVAELFREQMVPVIVVTAHADAKWVEQAQMAGVFGYLLKPITETSLSPAIAVTWRQFEMFQAVRQEAADLRQALEDRKVIERAKGVLMKRGPMDEQAAFRRLQKLASEKSRKLIDIAHTILLAEEAVLPP